MPAAAIRHIQKDVLTNGEFDSCDANAKTKVEMSPTMMSVMAFVIVPDSAI
jgi:hypothetical protein